MNTKKMTAFIVGAMLIATVLVMAVSAAGMDRGDYADMPRMVYEFDADTDTGIYVNDGPTLRIYGEADAIYPTQSYTEADDFIYPDPVDAFDPGVIGKDSVTFNPAYMADVVSVNDGVSFGYDEKVFFRVFYEPGYDHVIDELMDTTDPYDTDLTPVSMPDGALVTETTYMLLSTTGDSPMTGAAGPGSTYEGLTRFMLPVRSPTPAAATQPGMEEDARVGLYLAENGSIVTDGTIEVGLRVRLDLNGIEERFMDHNVTFVGCSASDAKFMISYIGNRNDRMPEPLPDPTLVPKNDGSTWGDPVYVTRYNEPSLTTDAEHRWFIRVINSVCDQYCDVVIGRRLVAGETFYADGVRYDMPAIYVTEDDKFKYITLQSPLPKCYDAECVDYWNDYSHVSCQWLTMLPPNTNVWVLPPFDAGHTMIDDIGLPKTSCTDGVTVTQAGVIYGEVPELQFNYTKEDTEDRFNTSLAERHARKDGVELWNWWSVFTKPYHYVELVLPNDEDGRGHDGYEYLITTSFIAPNSEADNRPADCKDPETHDIIDRAATIANDDDFDSRDAYSGMPRMVFEFDAVQTEDLFVNEDEKTVNLVEEDTTDGSVVPDGNCGTLTYTIDSDGILTYDFVVINNPPGGPHELVVIIAPELNGQGEWPQTGSMALTGLSGTADISTCLGWIDDGADYNGGVYGAKIWYVPTADFDGTKFTAWHPENILFEEDLIVPTAATVRIYGEGGAIYPTQSLTDDKDFIYPNHVDAFDPGVIAKDSATFNPAYIHSAYKNTEIQIDNGNGDEKVFFRVFYDPGYAHAIDAKMKIEYPNELRELNGTYRMPEGALVTETTYMLVKYSADGHSGLPKAGSAGEPGNSPTEFMLPINSLDGTVPGMDNAQVVELTDADYGGSLTSGEIEVSMTWDYVNPDNVRAFMDHRIRYRGTDADGDPLVDVWYVGNMQNRHDERRNIVEFVEGQKTYIDRHNQLSTTTTPRYRWFINVQNILGNDECKLTLGRRLVAGETFYVDGVRYDMPAIYVTEDEDAKFKYITFQSPLPKCDGPMWANDDSDQWDWSHVPSQWLANLVPQANDGGNANNVANVWVLPPFNDPHTMIDDIGIPKVSCGDDDRTIYSEAGNILGTVDPLEFYYIAEEEEPRFDSSLAERLNSDGSTEIWNWWSIFTKPYEYTELVLPDQETATMADGNEYLITTSFIAPNCEDEEREELCKSDREVHDIIDRASNPPVPECKGDFCGDGDPEPDGDIDAFDFVEFCAAYGSSVGDTNYNSAGDFCGDGDPEPDDDIDAFDFVEFCAVYGTSCP